MFCKSTSKPDIIFGLSLKIMDGAEAPQTRPHGYVGEALGLSRIQKSVKFYMKNDKKIELKFFNGRVLIII